MSSINEKILKIMALALEISPNDDRDGIPHVFIDYVGKFGMLSVCVYTGKLHKFSEWDYHKNIYINSDDEEADKVITYLEELKLKNGLI